MSSHGSVLVVLPSLHPPAILTRVRSFNTDNSETPPSLHAPLNLFIAIKCAPRPIDRPTLCSPWKAWASPPLIKFYTYTRHSVDNTQPTRPRGGVQSVYHNQFARLVPCDVPTVLDDTCLDDVDLAPPPHRISHCLDDTVPCRIYMTLCLSRSTLPPPPTAYAAEANDLQWL